MNKKILIIGGSSGFGRQLAISYASDGHKVGVIARRTSLLKELQVDFPGKIITRSGDIADTSIEKTITELTNELNKVDIIIVAASVIHFNNELHYKIEKDTIDINVTGYTNVLNIAWQYFKEQGYGQIVGITSIAAARGNKIAPAYHASKSFQSIYLESLRVKAKFEKSNIIVTELIPGYMETAMGKGDRMFWIASLEKATAQAKKAIEKKKTKAFITKRWWLVYHFQRVLPNFIYDSIVNGSWKIKRK